MRRLISLFFAIVLVSVCNAQFFRFPNFGDDIKLTSEPKIGLDGLSVGDEGYVIFSIINNGETTYTGPLYIRLFNPERSHQVLACKKNKLKPGKEYVITTVFSTEQMEPFSMYFIGFEYDENETLVPMAQIDPKPLKSFMLLQPIINAQGKKSPVKAKIKRAKK